jgi:hypothetical protein
MGVGIKINTFRQFHITVRSLSVSLCNRPTTLLFKKCGHYSWRKFWNSPWKYDREFAIHNIKKSLFLRCLHWCVFSRIPMIWRHDKVVVQRTSRATSRRYFITTMWWWNILYQTSYFRSFHRKTCIMLDKTYYLMTSTCHYIATVSWVW